MLLLAAFAQIVLGALVAGIDAGRSYIDWPLMAGELLPASAFDLEPVWRNFIDNPALVQFNHRLLGYLLLGLGIAGWLRSRRSALGYLRGAFALVLLALVVQVVLGIVTVLHAAPMYLAIAHQLLARSRYSR